MKKMGVKAHAHLNLEITISMEDIIVSERTELQSVDFLNCKLS